MGYFQYLLALECKRIKCRYTSLQQSHCLVDLLSLYLLLNQRSICCLDPFTCLGRLPLHKACTSLLRSSCLDPVVEGHRLFTNHMQPQDAFMVLDFLVPASRCSFMIRQNTWTS